MTPGDRAEAEAMARRGGDRCAAVFDEEAGWLLVPRPDGSPEKKPAAP